MRIHACLLLALPVLFAAGCGIVDPERTFTLDLHIQGGFAGDSVTVWIDDRVVYDAIATSDPVLGLADGARVDVKEGIRAVRVRVGTRADGVNVLEIQRTVSLGISLDPWENRVVFQVSDHGFVYY